MNDTLELTLPICYHLKRPPLAEDVIDTLQSISLLASEALPILAEYDRDHAPTKVECRVKDVKEGSLIHDLCFNFAFESPEAYQAWVHAFREITGINAMDAAFPILGPIFRMLLIVGGMVMAYRLIKSGKGTERDYSNHIYLKDKSQAIIKIGAGDLHIDPAVLKGHVDDSVKTKRVRSAVSSFFRPAKRYGANAQITFGDEAPSPAPGSKEGIYALNGEVISAMPDESDSEAPEKHSQIVEDTRLYIRAGDLDRSTGGWYAVPIDFSGKRLKLTFGDGVQPYGLRLGETIRAKLLLEYTQNEEGDRSYKQVTLLAINGSECAES